jgi:hypothetical protein
MSYLEMLSDEGKDSENLYEDVNIPAPVVAVEDKTPDKYEQDDIELV